MEEQTGSSRIHFKKIKTMTLNDLENIRLSLYHCDDKKQSIYKEYLQSLRKLAYKGNSEAQYTLSPL